MFNVKVLKYRGFSEFRLYEKPIREGPTEEEIERGKRGQGGPQAVTESMRRTREKVKRYGFANQWEWFCTLTFNPDLVDSYDYQACVDKLSAWLNNNRKRRAPDMRYIWVPERHISGRFHFHGLMSGISSLGLADSGKRDKSGRAIYNIGQYKLGWSTATAVTNSQAAVGYLLKYLTKDLCAVTFNRRRYWASKNLDLPEVQNSLLELHEQKELSAILKENATWQEVASVESEAYSNTICYYSIPQ